MSTPEEQEHTLRVFVRILAAAQFTLAVIAATALRFIYMVYGDLATQAAHPLQAADLNALAGKSSIFIGLATVTVLVLAGSVVSGVCILRRRARTFSLIVGVASLLLFPIGTLIGSVTLIVLRQKPVRHLYEKAASPSAI